MQTRSDDLLNAVQENDEVYAFDLLYAIRNQRFDADSLRGLNDGQQILGKMLQREMYPAAQMFCDVFKDIPDFLFSNNDEGLPP